MDSAGIVSSLISDDLICMIRTWDLLQLSLFLLIFSLVLLVLFWLCDSKIPSFPRRTVEIVNELTHVFGEIAAIPVQVLLTGYLSCSVSSTLLQLNKLEKEEIWFFLK